MSSKNKNSKIVQVAIIGGGPAGLSAAIYTSRAKLSTVVFAGSPPGGQLMLTTEVENYPGFKSILGPELVQRIREQAKAFGAEILDVNVKKVDFSKRPFTLFWGDEALQAEAVIIAVGARAKWLGLPSEQRLIGKGVSACATCDGFFFKDKVVAVVGGGDTAMEEALTLTKFAKKVYIIHRRDTFRASKIMQERVFNNPKIEIIWNAQVREVLGKERVEGVKLEIRNPKSEIRKKIRNSKFEIRNLPLDGLFIAIGHRPDTEIFKGQIELDEKGYVITSGRVMEEYAKFIKFQSPMTNDQTNSKFHPEPEQSTVRGAPHRAEGSGAGQIPNSKQDNKFVKLFENWSLELVNYRSAASVPGVFAAGDCVDFVYRQAATAVGAGVAAALEAERWLETVKS